MEEQQKTQVQQFTQNSPIEPQHQFVNDSHEFGTPLSSPISHASCKGHTWENPNTAEIFMIAVNSLPDTNGQDLGTPDKIGNGRFSLTEDKSMLNPQKDMSTQTDSVFCGNHIPHSSLQPSEITEKTEKLTINSKEQAQDEQEIPPENQETDQEES